MQIIFIVIIFCYILWIVRNILFWINLWQLKEYRFDRLFAHFRETTKARDILFSPFSLIKWLTIFLFVLPAIDDNLLLSYQIIVSAIYIVEAVFVVREVIFRKLRRPVITLRSLLVLVFAIPIFFLLFSVPLTERFLWLLLVDRFVPLLITIFVYLIAIPSDFVKDMQIERATQKIANRKDVLVIGISGSYGKSSTKEYVAQVLSQKFSVLKTEGSHNTPIGIAQTILRGLNETIEVFVVELGSYKRGEVAELCHIVHPKISITTSISDQHLSLFGSFENIMSTEKELIDALPKDGLALFDAENTNTLRLYKQTSKPKVLYGLFDKNNSELMDKDNITASEIIGKKNGVEFVVTYKAKKTKYKAPLLGIHSIENILPAIYLAHHLGIAESKIKEAVSQLVALPKRMNKKTHINGAVLLDDTFNASPESVIAGVSYLTLYNGRKVVVLEPMIELGSRGKKDHYELGKQIAHICDTVYLTNKSFSNHFIRGVKEAKGKCKVVVMSPVEIASVLNKTLAKDDAVLFEGREAAVTLEKLI